MVKEGTISIGESLVVDDLRRALAVARDAEIIIVVGSSLSVNPAAKIPLEGVRAGALLAIVNNEPTPLDDRAAYLVHAPAGAALRFLADRLVP
jgi:NAD-dependent deacetylase